MHRRRIVPVHLSLGGIVLQVLPIPFILLAAARYARTSTHFYNRVPKNPVFGPMILEWRCHLSILWRTKVTVLTPMAGALVVSILFFMPQMEL